MVEQEKIERHIDELQNELSIKTNGNIFQEFPLKSYKKIIKSFPKYKSLYNFEFTIKPVSENILKVYDAQVLALYHKLTLALFIKDSLKSFLVSNHPQSILQLYMQWFERVLNEFHEQPDDYYSHTNYSFVTDLSMCSLITIPIGGSWIVEVREIPLNRYFFGMGRNKYLNTAGGLRGLIGSFAFLIFRIQRFNRGGKGRDRFLSTGGPRQLVGLLAYLIFKIRGYKPFYTLHINYRFSGWSSAETDKCYLRIAELLERNPKMKGIFGHAWLFDPKLSEISPELAFLRQTLVQNGARIFRLGATRRALAYATRWSLKRRKLYEEGKYIPTEYMVIWPRKELLDWAKKERLSSS